MNTSEYIASGILESYVLGAVSDQERREVECLSSIYPEVRQELDQLAAVLEQYAFSHSVDPPASVKEKLLQELDFTHSQTPLKETIVRPLPVESSRPTFRVAWVVAASLGLLLLLFSFFMLSQLRTNQKTLASAREANGTLQNELRQLRDEQQQATQALALLQQPDMHTIELKGNEKAPQGSMLVFWNSRTQQVSINVQSLPALPPNMQYQLWSLVGSKPIDAGVFEVSNGKNFAQNLNRSIRQADAFAVTIEKRGGSPTPNLSTLLALGKLSV